MKITVRATASWSQGPTSRGSKINIYTHVHVQLRYYAPSRDCRCRCQWVTCWCRCQWKGRSWVSPYNDNIHAVSPDLPAHTETTTSNTEHKKKVFFLIPYPTLSLLTIYVFQMSGGVKRSNPIYLFYEVVHQNASGQPGDPGDKHAAATGTIKF
jgi:hypothetical protein